MGGGSGGEGGYGHGFVTGSITYSGPSLYIIIMLVCVVVDPAAKRWTVEAYIDIDMQNSNYYMHKHTILSSQSKNKYLFQLRREK